MHIRNAILALAAVASLAQAQASGYGAGGCSVGAGFECVMVHAHTGTQREERQWVRAIVLWKAEPWTSSPAPRTAEARANSQRYDALRREAEDSNRTMLGTEGGSHRAPASMTWGFPRRDADTLFVLGQRFEMPRQDSALVVMVDARTRDAAGAPRLIGIAWMPAAIDNAYWPKHWTSGDTSFTVRPPRDNRILRDALEKIPAVRTFLSDGR
jgi:hypothetical protein